MTRTPAEAVQPGPGRTAAGRAPEPAAAGLPARSCNARASLSATVTSHGTVVPTPAAAGSAAPSRRQAVAVGLVTRTPPDS